jgi:hypothetical protein
MSSIGALGLPAFPGQSGAGSTAGLEAQLARYQAQLADWVNCTSCNTPEGKAKIQQFSDKVSETKQSIEAANTPSQIDRPSIQLAGLTRDTNQNKATPTLNVVGSGNRPSIDPASVSGAVGTRLNVYA